MSSWLFYLLHLTRRIWVRTGLISALAVVAAAVSPVIGPLLPDKFAVAITIDATQRLLDILSATMLTITTFSMTVITATHLTAGQTATPRIHRLLREDGSTQTVLATFMGAFVYALVTIVLLNLRIHEKEDFGTVYVFTVGVIALVVIAVLRWIQQLTTLGAMDTSVALAASRAEAALETWRRTPWLGGHRADGPEEGKLVESPGWGYLQNVDLPALAKLAGDGGGMRLLVRPGDYLARGQKMALVTGAMAAADPEDLTDAFVLGPQRTWDSDPAYGLIVLSEIASRALSPAINDPRTAEAVAITMHRLLAPSDTKAEPPVHDWLTAPDLSPDDLMHLAIDPIARDGRAFVEVQVRLQEILAHLAATPDPALGSAARAAARRALAYADQGLLLDDERTRVRAAAPV